MIMTKAEAVRELALIVSVIETMLDEVEGFDMESGEWKRLISDFEVRHSYYFDALESMESYDEEVLPVEMRNWATLTVREGRRDVAKFDEATSELL